LKSKNVWPSGEHGARRGLFLDMQRTTTTAEAALFRREREDEGAAAKKMQRGQMRN